jgi:phosphoribosylglycinamide formyltransferase-1
MRIFSEGFIRRFPGRIVNIHPSLLPAFPGLHTHAQALAAGVKVHGATVHIVTPALDNGPIVIQGVVPVLPDDTEEALSARVLAVEHRIYPQAVRWFVEGRIEFDGAGVVRVRDSGVSTDCLVSPRERP